MQRKEKSKEITQDRQSKKMPWEKTMGENLRCNFLPLQFLSSLIQAYQVFKNISINKHYKLTLGSSGVKDFCPYAKQKLVTWQYFSATGKAKFLPIFIFVSANYLQRPVYMKAIRKQLALNLRPLVGGTVVHHRSEKSYQ